MRKATTCEDCKQTFQSKKLWSEHIRDRKCTKVATERFEEDVVLIDDDLPEDKTAKTNISLINESPDCVEEMEEEEETKKEEADDDIQVVKSSIYKYHGDLNYKEQVKGDYFSFKYFDDFEDNDDVILMEEVDSEEIEIEEEENDAEYAPMNQSDDSGEKINKTEIGGVNIPIQKMEMKQFPGGNFFMVAS